MAGIETAVEDARRYIIKRPRLTRLLDRANARVLMLIGPAGFGKTTLAREWVSGRPHVWYRGTPASIDVAALGAGLAELASQVIPHAGSRMVHRMRATGTQGKDVGTFAELLAEDLVDWPEDTWLVIDDYQFAMEAKASERFVHVLLRNCPLRLLLTSRTRPTWASARQLLYGEVYELGRTDLAMDHNEAAAVLAHRKDAPAAGLVALAEGWPAVIGLAALADDFDLPEGTLPASLYEYFAEELYQAASHEVQRGLRRLALAPSLAEGVAEFLLGEEAPEVIAEGMRLGFLSARSGTLELHPLLRTFLDTKQTRTEVTSATLDQLARHLTELGSWDDAFALARRFFSKDRFLDLLERALGSLIREGRLLTLSTWLDLAHAHRVDAGIIDLAEAEIAFWEARRADAEALALRAARRLADHPLLSHTMCIAGTSARLGSHNLRAKAHFERALGCAKTVPDRRDAVWGQLQASLDLNADDVADLFVSLVELDDGSATSEVRLANAHFMMAVREGTLNELPAIFDSAEKLLLRITDPLTISSFLSCRSSLFVLLGRYQEGRRAALRCERYAADARLNFVIAHAKRARAAAELGLRRFTRSGQIIDWLEREALRTNDVFLELEARLLRSRLLLALGLADRAVRSLKEPPQRFPFDAERGEYLATLSLAYACCDKRQEALQLIDEAVAMPPTVEVRALAPCVGAIVALQAREPGAQKAVHDAFQTVADIGCVDFFVSAYRGFPALLAALPSSSWTRPWLNRVIEDAHDEQLARAFSRSTIQHRASRQRLTPREKEVLALIGQGLTNREIAGTLFISEATAKVHVLHILDKLGVRSRTEAALKAVQQALEGPEES
jgi:DNA-binding CsgD family transcriptional regulator